MDKSTTSTSSLSLSRSSFDDHPVFDWLENNGKSLFFAGIILAILLILLLRYTANQNTAAEHDYFQAANAVELLQNPSKAEGALNDLRVIIAKHPELNARYDGIIAQDLLAANEVSQAKPYAEKNFHRVASDLNPLFLKYSENSLLIAEGKLEDALKNAKLLKAEMQENFKNGAEHFEPKLYLFNLIRIGMIEKTLNLHSDEFKTWEELLQISKKETSLPITTYDFEKVIKHFEITGVTFLEFIRESSL